jgi:sulfite oxidase
MLLSSFSLCLRRDYSDPLNARLNFGRLLQSSISRRPQPHKCSASIPGIYLPYTPGPLLKDVLHMAGLSLPVADYKHAHVAFACYQTRCQDDEFYGASIPLCRALDPKRSILVALSMNDEPLTPNHGAPVRIVTPGIAGARSVKWLDRITVQMEESSNYYQQHDYKILPPEADTKERAEYWWSKVDAIQDMPVNSVIAVPASNTTCFHDCKGFIEVKGYALPSGADGPITKVEVSVDDGKTWIEAKLKSAEGYEEEGVELKWAWTLWEAEIKVEKGRVTILSRATDTSGRTQERCPEWNFRGVGYNGYGEVSGVNVQ